MVARRPLRLDLSRAVPVFDDHGEISEWFGAAWT
jgi:hypothetical protein